MDCGSRVAQILLFIFNFLIFLGGLVCVILLAISANKSNVFTSADGDYSARNITLGIIAVFAVVMLIAFLGCCGAFTKSYCMLITYAVILIIILITQLVVGAILLYFGNSDDAKDVVKDAMNDTLLASYNKNGTENKATLDMWNTLQKELECCGVDGPGDWCQRLPAQFSCTPTLGSGNPAVPDSCCKKNSTNCNYKPVGADDGYYQEGCTDKVWDIFHKGFLGSGIVCFVFGVIQLIAIIMSCCFAREVKSDY